MGVGTYPPNLNPPDYLITTDVTGGSTPCGGTPCSVLWEATTLSGSGWTMIGPIVTSFGTTDIEFAIPWAAFSCLPSSCPAFAPGTTAYITVMTTIDGADAACAAELGDAGTPCGGGVAAYGVDDVFSEVAAGTHTTTPTSCTIPGTACELFPDNSADAFIQVTYASPTAIGLNSFATDASHPVFNWAMPALFMLGCSGLAVFWLRRRRRY